MTIDPISSAATTQTATPTAGALTGSKDEFLRLFMAQLEHQDPLNPAQGADMVAQLAQFTSVEQATLTNQHLSDLASQQASSASASLANLVGRTCSAGAADFQLDRGGAVPPLEITSTSAMNGAAVVITDDSGKEIRRIPIPAGASSAHLAWDGKTSGGAPAAAGSYHLAVDPGKSGGTITSQWHGRVDAVELGNGMSQLRMGGILLAPAAIQTIGMSSAPPTTTTP